MSDGNAHNDCAVRPTTLSDIDEVMAIYDHARLKMRKAGNMAQWINGYPSREVISNDIRRGGSFVIEREGNVAGVFAFIIGEEPTYAEIDGAWPDNKPYGTIHRIASARNNGGIADIALDYCKKQGVNVRIDTHADNAIMLGWIAKRGFTYCGIIRVEDGSPRKAFQFCVL